MNILQTIEADLQAAGKWLENEFEVAAKDVWSVVVNVFQAQEPAVVSNVLTAVRAFLVTALDEVAKGTPLENLETMFLDSAQAEVGTVLQDAKQIGSTMIQALIALAIKDLPALAAK